MIDPDIDGARSASDSLRDRVVLVTGGGRGLGRHLAEAFASAGAAVVVLARTPAELSDVVSTIAARGGRAMAVVADVTVRAEVERAVEEAERALGPIDVLVNNAGRFQAVGPLWELDPDDWWRELEVNLRGPMLCTRAVLPGMRLRGRGWIVNVVSGASCVTLPAASAYSTGKTALLRLTDTVAKELDGTGVSVFGIDPGTLRTPMNERLLETHAVTLRQWAPWFVELFEAGGEDAPEPAAALVLALASGRADALSGRFLSVRADLEVLLGRTEQIDREDLLTLRLRSAD
jgi:NAD(P)-dependent dehydrogenase (short-subunit alcohol dehydrogenase family)